MSTESCKVAGAVPLPGEIANQEESDDAVKFNVPAPEFVTPTVALGGFEPP